MKNKGFTLFIAMIVAGTLLLIATGIVSLAVRQALVSTSGRESQQAFYAADSGVECALFWDVQNPSGSSAFSASTGSRISCNNQNNIPVGGSATSTFTFDFSPDPFCVVVTVNKGPTGTTRIESKGYNTCSLLSPRRVERALRVTY
ncbi:MAG: pilus assembly PilX N-terminal domain-containing protein [bacterium]|nr:pilus assembly PilX N-terminal domain-containing protein [bacterium]